MKAITREDREGNTVINKHKNGARESPQTEHVPREFWLRVILRRYELAAYPARFEKSQKNEKMRINATATTLYVLLKFATGAGLYSMFWLRATSRFGGARTPRVLNKMLKNH